MSDLLSSPAVVRLTGATYRQLDYWTSVGWIHPETATTGGARDSMRAVTSDADILGIRSARDNGVPPTVTQRRYGISQHVYYAIINRTGPYADNPAAPRQARQPSNPGSGRTRRWSDAERVVIGRMARLVRAGLHPDAAVKVARSPGVPVALADGVTVCIDYHELMQDARRELALARSGS